MPISPGIGESAQKDRKPESRKSQYEYLRPDLGTQILSFEHELGTLFDMLGIDEIRTHQTPIEPAPCEQHAQAFMRTYHAWDIGMTRF